MSRKRDTYLIDELLPAGRIHIFSGPSGSGKTTLLFQWMKRWLADETVLGQASRKIVSTDAFYYISTDRVQSEMDETLARIGIDPDNLPNGFIAKAIVDPQFSIGTVTNSIPPNARIVFIEGAHVLVDGAGMNSAFDVASFLKGLSKTAEERDLAIWLSTGAPKQKKGEEYLNPRERITGSAAWGAFSSTIFNLTLDDPRNVRDRNRTLCVFPRNHVNREFSLQQDDHGRLIEVAAADTFELRMKLRGYLRLDKPTAFKEIREWATSTLGTSLGQLNRALEALEERHEIENQGRGKYVRLPETSNAPGLLTEATSVTPTNATDIFGVKF